MAYYFKPLFLNLKSPEWQSYQHSSLYFYGGLSAFVFFLQTSCKYYFFLFIEVLAKVSNGHPPQPLPSREGLIYQPSPMVGEGKGEGVNGLLQEPLLLIY
jgi:hypothetical protein